MSLWRNTDNEWLLELLKSGNLITKGDSDFFSFSLEEDSGGTDDFGETRIELDKDIMIKQGAIEVYYEEAFFEQYPNICRHVTGFLSKTDYYDSADAEDDEDAYEKGYLTWLSQIESYEHEQEFVLKEIKLVPGLIKSVEFLGNPPDGRLARLLGARDINIINTKKDGGFVDPDQLKMQLENKKFYIMKKYVPLFEEYVNENNDNTNESKVRNELKLNPNLVNKHFVSKFSDNVLKKILSNIDKKIDTKKMKRKEVISHIFSLMD